MTGVCAWNHYLGRRTGPYPFLAVKPYSNACVGLVVIKPEYHMYVQDSPSYAKLYDLVLIVT